MFTGPLCLEAETTPDEWILSAPLTWRDENGRVTAPKGLITDLASIPAILRNVLDVNGRSRRPAVIHDACYGMHNLSRADADRLLYRMLREEGESAVTAAMYWAGVRLGGLHAYCRRSNLSAADFATQDDYDAWNWTPDSWPASR